MPTTTAHTPSCARSNVAARSVGGAAANPFGGASKSADGGTMATSPGSAAPTAGLPEEPWSLVAAVTTLLAVQPAGPATSRPVATTASDAGVRSVVDAGTTARSATVATAAD